MELISATTSTAIDDRRQHDRVDGPFDGRRVNALETPVRIFDISEGGCFVTSLHDQQPGVSFVLKIDLPYAGWITVKARTLYYKPEFGFAVRFTEMSDEAKTILKKTIEQLKCRGPYDI